MPAEGARERAGQHRTAEQRLDALEDSVAALAHEVRTRRLLVAGGEGEPQIVCEVRHGTAELRLETADGTPPRPALVLYASSAAAGSDRDDGGLGPATGIQLWADGDAVAELDAWCDDAVRWRGRLHIEEGGS